MANKRSRPAARRQKYSPPFRIDILMRILTQFFCALNCASTRMRRMRPQVQVCKSARSKNPHPIQSERFDWMKKFDWSQGSPSTPIGTALETECPICLQSITAINLWGPTRADSQMRFSEHNQMVDARPPDRAD